MKKKNIKKLKQQKAQLENQLKQIQEQLLKSEGGGNHRKEQQGNEQENKTANQQQHQHQHQTSNISSSIHIEKSGYLYKWQDRTIGWTGTKWDLRFVRLERGRLSYYRTHNEPSPRYILTLRNCAVRDDGFKPNSKYWKRNSEVDVDIQTPGAYYHVFSIYQRHEDAASTNASDKHEDVEDIIPLLRFSTQSYAEKSLWIEQLSEACAFCDTDEFVKLEQEAKNFSSQSTTTHKHGTLPPMFFAPVPPKIQRQPSNTSLKKSAYVKLNTRKDAPRSNTQSRSGYAPSRPMHRSTSPSYLSDEAPMQNYRGLLNLGLIILVISNFRILLDTMRLYGFVVMDWIKPLESTNTYWKAVTMVDFPLLSGLGILFIFVNCAYLIELAISRKIWSEWFGLLMHGINANAALLIPTAIVWYQMDNIIGGEALIICAVILWMKLISYAHANSDYRNHPESRGAISNDFIQNIDEGSKTMIYPMNITLSNIYYFWLAPTLTYQIAFPRLMRRNWLRIITLCTRLFLSNVLIIFLIAQVISPNLQSLTKDLEDGKHVFSVDIFVDYLLKLAIASTYIWLLVFYSYFHLFFNLLAELVKFGDRVFYKDWWNSSNVSSYWRLWNLPVHYWLVRHLYFPCLRIGMHKNLAMIIVFFFSAVMHEYVISIPFHMIRPWSFLGLMGQIPLVAITKYIDKLRPGSSIGNMIFWLTFCIVGQPMAILMYTIDYYNKKESDIGEECTGISCDEL